MTNPIKLLLVMSPCRQRLNARLVLTLAVLSVTIASSFTGTRAHHLDLKDNWHTGNIQLPEGGVYQFIPGKIIQQRLDKSKTHIYQIALSIGQCLQIIINEPSTGLRIRVFAPSLIKLQEFITRKFGPTPLCLIASTPGLYRVEIELLNVSLESERYELIAGPLHKATLRDSYSSIAEKAFNRGTELREQWKSESILRAIYSYEDALIHWRKARNQREEASALLAIGDSYSALGQNQKALAFYNQAIDASLLAGDHRLRIEALNSIGAAYIDFGKTDKTEQYCAEARDISRQIRYARGEAQALNNMGLVAFISSDMKKALHLLNQAMTIWQSIGDVTGQAQTLTNIIYVFCDLGDIQQALPLLEKALTLYAEAKDLRGKALILTTKGWIYSVQGETQKVLDLNKQAKQLSHSIGDLHGEAVALNNLGYLFDDLGDKQKALDYYSEALTLYKKLGNIRYSGITMGYIGRVYNSIGQREKALSYFNEKLALSRILKDPRMEAYTLKDIGIMVEAMGRSENALEYYKKAFALSKSIDDRRGQAYVLNNIGHIYEIKGEKRAALGFYEQAVDLTRTVEDRRGEMLTRHNISRVLRDMGKLSEGLKHIQAALDIAESLRSKATNQEIKASCFASFHQHYGLQIDILMQMHMQNPSGDFDAAALETSERARARCLLDLLTEARVDIREGVDKKLLERERTLQQSLNLKSEGLIKLQGKKHTEQQTVDLRREIEELMNDYYEVGANIRSSSPHYAALTQPLPLRLPEIQSALDSDTLLLEYSVADERSYLWAVTQTEVRSFELPGRTKIEQMAGQMYNELTAPNRIVKGETSRQWQIRLEHSKKQCLEIGAQLSRILLEPVASMIEGKRLLIVADGALQYLPFSVLPDPAYTTPGNKNPQPLIVDHEIVSLPSISTLAALRTEVAKREAAKRTIAIVADPVFDQNDERILLRKNRHVSKNGATHKNYDAKLRTQSLIRESIDFGSPDANLSFYRLPFARQEAEAIAELVPKQDRKLAMGFEASRMTVINSELAQYRIVHFATHGLFDSLNPELSCIVLSLVDEQGNQQPGLLGLHEVYNLKLNADMVTLSSCQTALGKQIKGEGLVGLTRGFMYAGAARVAAALWKVDDRASAELMKYFYREMFGQKKLRPAAALRIAQISMRKQYQWDHPYYWAAFILQGEWK